MSIQERIEQAYMRGFRHAVAGHKLEKQPGVSFKGVHTAYTLGYENGSIAIDAAKELAKLNARETVGA